MTNENTLIDNVADEIIRLHTQAEATQTTTMDGINELINARLKVASLVAVAKANHGSRYNQWWRDQGLPVEWGKRYLTLSKKADRVNVNDKTQMRLIGIIPEATDSEKGEAKETKATNPYAWVKLASKLKVELNSINLETMEDFDKETTKLHLKPIVDFFNQIA